MTVLSTETTQRLSAFLDGRDSAQDLESWIIEVEDDRAFSQMERDELMQLRLYLLEAGEGTRSASQVKQEAWRLLLASMPIQTSTSSNSVTIGRPSSPVMTLSAGSH
jgi:hypothetical protein